MRMEAYPKIKRKKNRSKIWLRLLIALGIIAAFGWWFQRPYSLYYKELQAVEALENQHQQILAENERLKLQYESLQTKEGKISKARSLGYVLPGEQVIVLPNFPEPPKPAIKEPSSMEKILKWIGK